MWLLSEGESWERITPYIGKYRHIYLSDADDPGIVKFKTADLGTEFLGYVAEHKTVLQSLQEYINQCANVNWLCPAKTCGVAYEAHQRGEDIGEVQVLKRYERWRKSENFIILGFTDLLDRIFSNNWLPAIILRRLGLRLLRNLPPFKIFALKLMTGFQGRIPQLGNVN